MTADRRPLAIVVMGVSAAGKTTVGRLIAQRFDADFLDADDLHPPANRAKMAAGIPLNDEDRMPWLDRVSDALSSRGQGAVVIACSALRRVYRDRLRLGNPGVTFVHLHASRDVLAERAVARTDHFMPSTLLDSQIATLELLDADEQGVVLDVKPAPEIVADAAVDWIASRGA